MFPGGLCDCYCPEVLDCVGTLYFRTISSPSSQSSQASESYSSKTDNVQTFETAREDFEKSSISGSENLEESAYFVDTYFSDSRFSTKNNSTFHTQPGAIPLSEVTWKKPRRSSTKYSRFRDIETVPQYNSSPLAPMTAIPTLIGVISNSKVGFSGTLGAATMQFSKNQISATENAKNFGERVNKDFKDSSPEKEQTSSPSTLSFKAAGLFNNTGYKANNEIIFSTRNLKLTNPRMHDLKLFKNINRIVSLPEKSRDFTPGEHATKSMITTHFPSIHLQLSSPPNSSKSTTPNQAKTSFSFSSELHLPLSISKPQKTDKSYRELLIPLSTELNDALFKSTTLPTDTGASNSTGFVTFGPSSKIHKGSMFTNDLKSSSKFFSTLESPDLKPKSVPESNSFSSLSTIGSRISDKFYSATLPTPIGTAEFSENSLYRFKSQIRTEPASSAQRKTSTISLLFTQSSASAPKTITTVENLPSKENALYEDIVSSVRPGFLQFTTSVYLPSMPRSSSKFPTYSNQHAPDETSKMSRIESNFTDIRSPLRLSEETNFKTVTLQNQFTISSRNYRSDKASPFSVFSVFTTTIPNANISSSPFQTNSKLKKLFTDTSTFLSPTKKRSESQMPHYGNHSFSPASPLLAFLARTTSLLISSSVPTTVLPVYSSSPRIFPRVSNSLPTTSLPVSSLPTTALPTSTVVTPTSLVDSSVLSTTKPFSSFPTTSSQVSSSIPTTSPVASSVLSTTKPVTSVPTFPPVSSSLPITSPVASSVLSTTKPVTSVPTFPPVSSSLPITSPVASSVLSTTKPVSSVPTTCPPVSSSLPTISPVTSVLSTNKPFSSVPTTSPPVASSVLSTTEPDSSVPTTLPVSSSLPTTSPVASSVLSTTKPVSSSVPTFPPVSSSLPTSSLVASSVLSTTKPVSYVPTTSPPVSSSLPTISPVTSVLSTNKPFSSVPTTSPPVASSVLSTTEPDSSVPTTLPVSSSLPTTSLVASSVLSTTKPVSSSVPTFPPVSSSLPTSSPVASSVLSTTKPVSYVPTTSPPVSSSLPTTSPVTSSVLSTSKPFSSSVPTTSPVASFVLSTTKPVSSVATTLPVSSSLPTTSPVASSFLSTTKPVSSVLTFPPVSSPLPTTSPVASSVLSTSKPFSSSVPTTSPVAFSVLSTTKPDSSVPTTLPVSSSLPTTSPVASSVLSTSKPFSSSVPTTSPVASFVLSTTKPVSSVPTTLPVSSPLPTTSPVASSFLSTTKPVSSVLTFPPVSSPLPTTSPVASSVLSTTKPVSSSVPTTSPPVVYSSVPLNSPPVAFLHTNTLKVSSFLSTTSLDASSVPTTTQTVSSSLATTSPPVFSLLRSFPSLPPASFSSLASTSPGPFFLPTTSLLSSSPRRVYSSFPTNVSDSSVKNFHTGKNSDFDRQTWIETSVGFGADVILNRRKRPVGASMSKSSPWRTRTTSGRTVLN